ncbi:hypothetical protein ACE939_04545 [Aquimarina sp. W85]|uniref:hypothetical protein n=1 Tax=Aquimarina rhodophyticola TaxID=3342246 RepID=UPI003670385D
MKTMTALLCLIALTAFTSCSDTSLQDNEEVLQLESTAIEKDEYEIPTHGYHTEQYFITTETIEKDEYEIPTNG